MDSAEQIRMKVAELEQMLLTNVPTMPNLLGQIHKNIQQEPELAYALSDDEIGVIVRGILTFTKTEITAPKPKTKKVDVSSLSLDDF